MHILGILSLLAVAAVRGGSLPDGYPRQPLDVEHYRFAITLSDTTDRIDGQATVRMRLLAAGLTRVELDLADVTPARQGRGMVVSAVTMGERALTFTHAADRLVITLSAPSTAGAVVEFVVRYAGIPADGLQIKPNSHGDRGFFSDNWPDKARHWLPLIDHVADKATMEMDVTAPAHYRVISNGKRLAEADLPGNRRHTVWREGTRISPWLYALGVARFAVQHVGDYDGKPIETWVFAQDSVAGFHDFAIPSRDALAFYSEKIGPYQYEKLANVQSNSVAGGMEAASAIFYSSGSVQGTRPVRWRNVVIHEIAHQWFGNAITESDWNDVWLSEGFATYFTLLFIEHAYGKAAFDDGLRESRKSIYEIDAKLPNYRVIHENLTDMSKVTTRLTYEKGAWVLHMLRQEMGDTRFWAGIRDYYARHLNGTASTADFRKAMERASGKNLAPFFQQWLYRGGLPRVEGTWTYDAKAQQVVVELTQVQPGDPFRLPVEISVDLPAARMKPTKVEFSSRRQRFTIDVDQAPMHVYLDPDLRVLMDAKLTSRTSLGAQASSGAPFPRPVGSHPVAIERGVMVPMRDGTRLATDIYRPSDVSGARPTILMRTPYNKGANPKGDGSANFFASHGFTVAVQDVRGKFASEGSFRVYEGDTTDWSDMFDWIGRQPWSSGKVGTYGCSYLGEGQIIAAQQRHPRHVAAIPQAAGGNLGRVGRRRQFWGSVEGGAFSISINFGWMPVYASLDKGARPMPKVDLASYFMTLPVIDMADRAGSPSWDWRNFLERSPDDPWWDARGYLTDRDSASVAALHVSSWFDMAEEALEEAAIFKRNGTTERARTGQYAIISPSVHCASEYLGAAAMSGELAVGDARLRYWETYLAWFDRWLNDNVHAIDSLPRFQYYTIGRNAWRSSDRWPLPNMRETPFYLDSDGGANGARGNGRLRLTPPARAASDTFTYDPATPVPSRGGSICCTGNPKDEPGSYNQADIEQRPDVLVYTGEVLRTGLELTGAMRAVISLSSDARDTDVTVKLIDLFPDGRAMNIEEGITRVRYREGYDRGRLMAPGTIYDVPVHLHATSWYLPPGHRLRVEVSSSNFPRFDRNLNTGGKNYDETTWKVAHNMVHHSRVHASRLILPVVR